MTHIAAPFWNQIAETQSVESPAARVAFTLNDSQLARMDDLWESAEEAAGMSPKAVLCLTTYLPLLTESFPICQWVSEHPEMRGVLPEILSPGEALIYAQGDYRLTPSETAELEHALSNPEPHLERWLAAAEAVQTGAPVESATEP